MDEYITVESDTRTEVSLDNWKLHATIWMNCTSLSSHENSKTKVSILYDSIYINVLLNADKNMKGAFCSAGKILFLIPCDGDTWKFSHQLACIPCAFICMYIIPQQNHRKRILWKCAHIFKRNFIKWKKSYYTQLVKTKTKRNKNIRSALQLVIHFYLSFRKLFTLLQNI